MPDSQQWAFALLLVGGLLGIGRWMILRIVKQTDDDVKEIVRRITVNHDRIMRLEGTVSAESWGLVSVVGKLNSNVEKLTSAVEHINTVVTMQKERLDHG